LAGSNRVSAQPGGNSACQLARVPVPTRSADSFLPHRRMDVQNSAVRAIRGSHPRVNPHRCLPRRRNALDSHHPRPCGVAPVGKHRHSVALPAAGPRALRYAQSAPSRERRGIMLTLILTGALAVCGVMFLLWLIHFPLHNAAIVDAGWAGGLALLGVLYAVTATGWAPRRLAIASMALLWGLRLALYLLLTRVI